MVPGMRVNGATTGHTGMESSFMSTEISTRATGSMIRPMVTVSTFT